VDPFVAFLMFVYFVGWVVSFFVILRRFMAGPKPRGNGPRRLVADRWLLRFTVTSDFADIGPVPFIIAFGAYTGVAVMLWPLTYLFWRLRGRPVPPVYFTRQEQQLPAGQGKKI
jgi:hypothetical protein